MAATEKHVLPNGLQVLFEPEEHRYTVEGRELPSITQLLSRVYGDAYGAVDPELLARASAYGTAVHEEIGRLIEGRELPGDPVPLDGITHTETLNYFRFVEPIYKIEPLMSEKVVVLNDDLGAPMAAGRFDLFCKQNGDPTLADFKTTSAIHRQRVAAQLNLYLRAARQSGYLDNYPEVKLAAIHLSGAKYHYVPMPLLGDGFFAKFTNEF